MKGKKVKYSENLTGKKIYYDKIIRKISEDEGDHIHLDDGTVVRKNEIVIKAGMLHSTYSEKDTIKYLSSKFYLFDKRIDKLFKNLTKRKRR